MLKEKVDLKKRNFLKNSLFKAGLIGAGVIGLSKFRHATSIFWRDESGNLTNLKSNSSASDTETAFFPTNTTTERLWTLPGWYSYAIRTQASGDDKVYYCPIYLSRDMTFDRIAVYITTTSAEDGEVARMGIYEDNNGEPGDLIIDAGTVDITTTGRKEITINQSLTKGKYWVAGCAESGWATFRTVHHYQSHGPIDGKSSDVFSGTYSVGYGSGENTGYSSGGLPDPAVIDKSLGDSYQPRFFVMLREDLS